MIKLKLMHPDHCCGLRPLSQFVLKIGFLLLMLGLMNGVYLFTAYNRLEGLLPLLISVGPIVSVVTYTLFSPMLFFLPLIPAHHAMLRSKQKLQMLISSELDNHLENMSLSIEQGQFDVSEHSHIEFLSSCKRDSDSLPVWPFDFGTLAKFTSLVLFPLMTTAIGIGIQELI